MLSFVFVCIVTSMQYFLFAHVYSSCRLVFFISAWKDHPLPNISYRCDRFLQFFINLKHLSFSLVLKDVFYIKFLVDRFFPFTSLNISSMFSRLTLMKTIS